MLKKALITCCIVILAGVAVLGCEPEMVGAPCKPETDPGTFTTDMDAIAWSIESRSVQCETRVCVTKTMMEYYHGSEHNDACKPNEGDDPDILEHCQLAQVKYSFCSDRCMDIEGHTLNENPDKYSYLIECPPNTVCPADPTLPNIEGAPEKLKGHYCIPRCIHNPTECEAGQVCVPSTDSEKPWEWHCEDRE